MFTRRSFITGSIAATACLLAETGCQSVKTGAPTDELIAEGLKAALEKTLYPALRERAYPGHFMVVADGHSYGEENTWCGLDSWEMAGAYLLVGKQREVLDYFDVVQAAQRKDGNIPFAIFPADRPLPSPDSYLRAIRFPQEVYTYTPRVRPGQPGHASMKPRKWIGLYTHWQTKVNPLSTLGAASYILTAAEIYAAMKSKSWLREKMESIEAAGNYLLSRISPNGLMGGAGFYIESPPRNQWDGVTQCYGIYIFRQLAVMNRALGRSSVAKQWRQHADKLSSHFQYFFWLKDHFAEYVHPEHGVVDAHGLSDVNWAAIGLGVARDRQAKVLWPILTGEPAFWHGNMPTQLVAKPKSYQAWELPEPLPFSYDTPTRDAAAMGRVWHLEALACRRMKDDRRLRQSVIYVCKAGKQHDWSWYERYPVGKNGSLQHDGTAKYCEYAAVLVRVVLGNPEVFSEAKHYGQKGVVRIKV